VAAALLPFGIGDAGVFKRTFIVRREVVGKAVEAASSFLYDAGSFEPSQRTIGSQQVPLAPPRSLGEIRWAISTRAVMGRRQHNGYKHCRHTEL
jgi:hypothetical protein